MNRGDEAISNGAAEDADCHAPACQALAGRSLAMTPSSSLRGAAAPKQSQLSRLCEELDSSPRFIGAQNDREM